MTFDKSTLQFCDKFVLTVYPIIYCLHSESRQTIHIIALILCINDVINKIIGIIQHKYNSTKFYEDNIKPVVKFYMLGCIFTQMHHLPTCTNSPFSYAINQLCSLTSGVIGVRMLMSISTSGNENFVPIDFSSEEAINMFRRLEEMPITTNNFSPEGAINTIRMPEETPIAFNFEEIMNILRMPDDAPLAA